MKEDEACKFRNQWEEQQKSRLLILGLCYIYFSTGRTSSISLKGQWGCDHCRVGECDGRDEERPWTIRSLQGMHFNLLSSNFKFKPIILLITVSRCFRWFQDEKINMNPYFSHPPVSPLLFLVARPSENSMRPRRLENVRIASWR